MRALIMLSAFLLPAHAPASARDVQVEDTPASAGPWVDCIRKLGREHFSRRDTLEDYQKAIAERCGDEGDAIRSTHPNVFRLSLADALDTYAYCLRPGSGGSQRCRILRSIS